jgi:hypothetical protein
MRTIGPAKWLAITATVPGACAATAGDTPADVILLATGIVGLALLTCLSERWRRRHPTELTLHIESRMAMPATDSPHLSTARPG